MFVPRRRRGGRWHTRTGTRSGSRSALRAGSDAAAGKALFQQACAPCHGGGDGDADRRPRALDLFPVLDANGSPEFTVLPDGTIVTTLRTDHLHDEFLTLGIAGLTYLIAGAARLGRHPRQPRRARLSAGTGRAGDVISDARRRWSTRRPRRSTPVTGQPIIGRNFFLQLFTVDPGAGADQRRPREDFEAFDAPQPGGISAHGAVFHRQQCARFGDAARHLQPVHPGDAPSWACCR